MLPSEVFSEARDLIRDGGHAKKVYATDAKGKQVSYNNPVAKYFCPAGAMLRVIDRVERERGLLFQTCFDLMKEARPHEGGVQGYNDRPETTQDDVIEWFDAAIELAVSTGK